MDRFGAQGPLLLSGPPASSSGEQASSESAPPEAAGSEDRIIGWCTFRGCSAGFTSWEKHVEHHMSSHIQQSAQRHFCPKCLTRTFSSEFHKAAHANAGLDCTNCSAGFLDLRALGAHMTLFHRHSPAKNLSRGSGAAAAPGTSRPSSVTSSAATSLGATSAATWTTLSATSSAPSCATSSTSSSATSLAAAQGDFLEDAATVLGWCTTAGCSETFSSWERYVDHCKSKHNPLLCSMCLSSHAEPHGATDWVCSRCPARFTDKSLFLIHEKRFHRKEERIPRTQTLRPVVGWCTIRHCDRPFCSWEDHVSHQKECHYNEQQVDALCHLCLQTDPPGGLQHHLQTHHQGDVPCPLCSARFLGDVSQHMAQFHHAKPDGSVPAVLGWCAKKGCGSSFSSWEDYVLHYIHKHSWVPNPSLVCHWCLDQHKQVVASKMHSKEHFSAATKHFLCDTCPARFFTGQRLTGHMRKFHKRRV